MAITDRLSAVARRLGVSQASRQEQALINVDVEARTPGLPLTLGIISPTLHGVVDYVFGASALLLVPRLLGFEDDQSARLSTQVVGATVLAVSAVTDYRYGLYRVIPFRIHLVLDLVSLSFLTLSPEILRFRSGAGIHRLLGLSGLLVVFLS